MSSAVHLASSKVEKTVDYLVENSAELTVYLKAVQSVAHWVDQKVVNLEQTLADLKVALKVLNLVVRMGFWMAALLAVHWV